MNLLKKTLLYYILLLGSYNLHTQEIPSNNQPSSTTKVTPVKENASEASATPTKASSETSDSTSKAETPTATTSPTEQTAPVKKEQKPEEKKAEEKKEEKIELSNWQDHLKSVLVKGEAWDKDNKTLKTDWQDKAFELAEVVIKKDISLADELINSFEDTINKKFTNTEEVINYKGYSDVIDLFKDKIKALVTELSSKEKKQEDNAHVVEQENNAAEEAVKEENISEPEEKTAEENIPQKEELSPSEKAEKKKEKRQSEWLECLENIKTGGEDEKEIKGILEEAARIAKKLLSSFTSNEQKDKADILKNEFSNAVNERSQKLFSINASTAIAQFNNEIDTLVKNSNPGEQQQPFTNPDLATRENNTAPQKNESNSTAATQENHSETVSPIGQQQSTSSQTTYVTTIQTDSSAQLLAQRRAEREKAKVEELKEQETQKKKQEELANSLKMKIAAAQAKTEAKKGIISSIMEKVFGTWWTKEPGTVEEIHKKQDALIKDRIKPFDPATQILITNAYNLFQKTLLDFDSKKFWNSDQSISKDYRKEWIGNITTSSKRLIEFNIMNLEVIIILLHETFKDKISVQQYDELIRLIKPDLEQYAIKLEEEKAKIKKDKEDEQIKLQEEDLNREKREKETIKKEKEAAELARQNAIKRFAQSEQEWKNLMKKIATSKPASKDTNAEFTKKALQITESMFKNLSFVPKKNKKDITEKHIKEFSQAFIEQGKRNKGSNPHDGDPLGIFNAQIHKIAEI